MISSHLGWPVCLSRGSCGDEAIKDPGSGDSSPSASASVTPTSNHTEHLLPWRNREKGSVPCRGAAVLVRCSELSAVACQVQRVGLGTVAGTHLRDCQMLNKSYELGHHYQVPSDPCEPDPSP